MKFRILIAVVVGLALGACQPADQQLAGTSWQLVSFGDVTNPIPTLPDGVPTLQFLPDGKFNANTGCNGAGGEYEVDGNNLKISNLIQTLIACTETDRANQEAAFVEGLNKAETFSLNGNQLLIYFENGTKALTFSGN
jgi:heat shock protein HslJ